MRNDRKTIVLERMRILVREASSNIGTEPSLASRQAAMARRLSSHWRVRMPYEMRMAFCRKCKTFVGYGTRSRIRIHKKTVRITCSFCGHVNRKILRDERSRRAVSKDKPAKEARTPDN